MGVDIIRIYVVKLILAIYLTDILNTDGRQPVVPL